MQRKKWRKLFEGNHKFVIFLSQKEIPVRKEIPSTGRKFLSQKGYSCHGRKCLSHEVNSCQRKYIHFTGRQFLVQDGNSRYRNDIPDTGRKLKAENP